MRFYTVFRLAFAGFLLYVAWPFIPQATTSLGKGFWFTWLLFFLLVVGGNLATFLHLSEPPVMEQEELPRERAKADLLQER